MSDTEEQESILNNLSKTRQLWSSKADLGTSDYLIPKTPLSPTATSWKNQLPNGDAPSPSEVVRADEQVVEDYELPDIKAMRSQWEVSNSAPSSFVPMPNAKSPAAMAREKSQKRAPPPEPVNRVEPSPEEETYDVELTKLKAQFESAAKAAGKSRPKSPKAPMPNHTIKDQVTRNPPARQQSTGNTNKKIRFEDEMTSSNENYVTEQRTETENLAVNLTGIKSQFESRKDEHLVTPQLSIKKTQADRSGYNRVASAPTQQIANQSDTSSHDNQEVSPRDEPVKSSEPVYDEMVGEESVKDRLKRYKSMTESIESPRPVVVKRTSQKRELPPILKRQSVSSEGKGSEDLDVVRSPPAGTRESVDYIPSVDLRQTKALFETTQPEASPRTLSSKRFSHSSSSSSSTPRTGRSSTSSSSRQSRCSSRQSTASSRSPSDKRSESPAPSSGTTSSLPLTSEDAMAEVVKPSPAGTKETPDYVPAVKVSSMKSMFENSESPSSPPAPLSPPRRQPSKEGWASPERKEESVEETDGKMANGEKDADVVRPQSAGTKEKPEYNLSSDFLKSRAAIFNAPPPKQYTPRNKVNTKQDNVPREVVNADPEQADTDYELSQSLKDTKKMFEKGGSVPKEASPPAKHPEPLRTPPPVDVVRPPPAGTREIDVVPASDIRSVKSRFENQQEVVETSSRKKPIDIRMEAAEVQRREKEIIAKPAVASDPQEEEVEKKKPEIVAQEPELIQPKPVEPEPVEPEPVEPEEEQKVPETIQEPEKETEPNVEEIKQDSDTESEGEYVIQKEQEVIQCSSSEEQVSDVAAVVPVRVALSNSNKGDSSSSSSSSDNEEQDSLDEAHLDASNSSPEQDTDSSVDDKPKQENLVQVEQGMSLMDNDEHESDEEDFDKPHFHYVYDNDCGPDGVGSLLNVPNNAGPLDPMGNGEPQIDANLLFDNSVPNSGDIILLDPLTSGPPPSHSEMSVDLLNGFGEVSINSTKAEINQEANDPFGVFETNEPAAKSDPFDIFGSIPASDSKQDAAPKDPFDLFLQ